MPKRLLRCGADIQVKDVPGKGTNIRLKPTAKASNCIQHQVPLSVKHPCFSVKVNALDTNSVVTIGIAGPDIQDDTHPGEWFGTVGYTSIGRSVSSHLPASEIEVQSFDSGDTVDVFVSYFGEGMSTVIFAKNDIPVATSYLFEADYNSYLPTITLQNGPADLDVTWAASVSHIPTFIGTNVLHWIRPPQVQHDSTTNDVYTEDSTVPELVMKCPLPLSIDTQCFEIIIQDVSDNGAGPTLGLTTCSAMYPPPTCPLMSDFFRWHPDGERLKVQVGQRMGWGIHYNPQTRDKKDFNDKESQLVLCYVIIDVSVVFAKMIMQPVGGYFPVVALHPYASRVTIALETNQWSATKNVLDDLFLKNLPSALDIVQQDSENRNVEIPGDLRKSDDLDIEDNGVTTTVKLSRRKKGVHVLQFMKPLTPAQRYFNVTVRKLGDNSNVCIGVADVQLPLGCYPGRSKDSVGYLSSDGSLYYNDKNTGNTVGKVFGKGDSVGLEIEVFEKRMSIVLFNKNHQPIGTRFLTLKKHKHFFPTIALCANGSDAVIEVVWQNRISRPPLFNVTNLEHWCMPPSAVLDKENGIISIDPAHKDADAIQAPYSLNRCYNHFEVELMDAFDESRPPPAIALCTASPYDPPPKTNFRQDFIRFWATGEAQKAVQVGDLIGWGILFPDDTTHQDEEQLVICYLTINRNVALTRVLYQPPGGFYPVVLMPPNVCRVKLNFGASVINEHPFTEEAIYLLIQEASQMILDEQDRLAQGGDPEEWDSEENKAKYLRPVPKPPSRTSQGCRFAVLKDDKEDRRIPKTVNLVELMTDLNLEDNDNKVQTHDAGVVTDPPRTVSAEGGPRLPAGAQEKSGKTASKTCTVL